MEINVDRNFKQGQEISIYREKALEFLGKALDAKDYMILGAYRGDEGLLVLNINAINPGAAFEAIATMIYRTCDSEKNGVRPSKKLFRKRVRGAMWMIWKSIKAAKKDWEIETAKNEFKKQ